MLVGGCHFMLYLFEFFSRCREKLNKSLVLFRTNILSLQNLKLLGSHKLNNFYKDSIFRTLLSCFKMGVTVHPRHSHAGITKCMRANPLRRRNIDWPNGTGDRIPSAWNQCLVRSLQLCHKIKRWKAFHDKSYHLFEFEFCFLLKSNSLIAPPVSHPLNIIS